MRVLYAQAVYGDAERSAVAAALDNGWLAHGPRVRAFEEAIARLFGKRFGVAVNSGSSANLLAVKALGLAPKSEVITPACTFSTTASAILLNDLVPVFVDVVMGRYVLDEYKVEAAINERTSAILVPQLVGGVANMPYLRELADRYQLALIDDSCDTLAPTIGHHDATPVATFADVTTTSFYGSHIITACGLGGMVMTDRADVAKRLICLRDWGRAGDDNEAVETRFSVEVNGVPYDSKFLYEQIGFNLKMNEVSAAFGLAQLERLPEILERRACVFRRLQRYFNQYSRFFHLPSLLPYVRTNWLAFPLTVRQDAPFTRLELVTHLEHAGIQTRVLFAGNITRHPFYRKAKWRQHGSLETSDAIMAGGFLVGAHQGMDDSQVEYLIDTAEAFLRRY